jgi:hypothetical protein
MPAPEEVLRSRVAAATAGSAWVVDGNYAIVRDLTWGRADTLVWLDYPLALVLGRLLRRTLTRMWRREELWGTGNREEWGNVFFARDSLFSWAVRQHGRLRRDVPALLTDGFAHLRWYRFRSPRAAAGWLGSLEPAPASGHHPARGRPTEAAPQRLR